MMGSTLPNNWDHRFMELARHIGQWSKDRSFGVGCVIVGPDREIRSTGYNGFPREVDDNVEERHERPAKYAWTEHAERNAIYNAARMGTALKGCTMYVPWYPCMDCARAIIQSGISWLVCEQPDWNDKARMETFQFDKVKEMFEEVSMSSNFSVIDINDHI